MGKIQIHVPWIAHQEVLTGIKDRVDELTAQSDLVKGLAQIAEVANKPEDVQEVVKQVERLRNDTMRDTVSRYEHWLNSAQAEVFPLSLHQSSEAWTAYFAGEAPFSTPKYREDLPDGFILQALLEIAAKHQPIHFIVEDENFRSQCSGYPQLVGHKDIYSFCKNLSVPLDIPSLKERSRLPIPISNLEGIANRAVQKSLLIFKLRFDSSATVAETLMVELVRAEKSFSLERNSVIPLEAADYVAAFSARYLVQGRMNPSRGSPLARETQAENFDVTLAGHVLLRFPAAEGEVQTPSNAVAELDSIEVTHISRSEDQSIIVLPTKPEFDLDRWHKAELAAVTAPAARGLVVVAGANQVSRRRVAEYLMTEKQRRDRQSELYLLGFPAELGATLSVLKAATKDSDEAIDELFDKARVSSATAVACSIEDGDWLPEALGCAVAQNAFVVATAKRLSSTAGVVKYLYAHPGGRTLALENLLAVAIITKVEGHRIKFRISQHGEWGDGSWNAILEHEEFVQKYRRP